MNLLVVTAEFPFGHGEGFLEDEIEALADNGTRIFVAPLRWWNRPRREILSQRITVIQLPTPSMPDLASIVGEAIKHPLRFVTAISWLTRDLRHFLKNLLTIPSALAIARFVRENGIEHIHAHWLSTSATAAAVAARWSGVPFSITTHRWDIFDGNLAHQKLAQATFLRFISESGKTAWLRCRPGNEEKLLVVRMGVKLPPAPKPPVEAATLRIACPANLIPVKGHQVLLQAVARLLGEGLAIELSIIGEGELRQELELLASRLGLQDACRFVGQLAHEDLLSLYRERQFDCVVLPSRDLGNGLHEGIPVSLMEAMSFGIPVVSTKTGGINELIRDRIDGLLAEGGDPDGLADRIAELAVDFDLRKRVAAAARERIATEFDVRHVSKRLLCLLEESRPAKPS